MPIAQRFNAGVKYLPMRRVPLGTKEPFPPGLARLFYVAKPSVKTLGYFQITEDHA